jgi:hypothetical protein
MCPEDNSETPATLTDHEGIRSRLSSRDLAERNQGLHEADEYCRTWRAGPARLVDAIVARAEDPETTVRQAAVSLLAKLGGAATAGRDVLRGRLRDESNLVRRWAGEALSKQRDEHALPFLVAEVDRLIGRIGWFRKLDSYQKADLATALESIERYGPAAAAALPCLVRCLGKADWYTAPRALSALGAIGPPALEAAPAVMKACRDSVPFLSTTRASAAAALAAIGARSPAHVSLVRELVMSSDEDPSTRVCAAIALWRMQRDGAVVDVLARLLQGPTWHRWRTEVLAALCLIGPAAAKAAPVVERTAKPETRFWEARTSWRLTGVMRDMDACLEELRGDAYMARHAAEVLGEVGPTAARAAPRLQELVSSERRLHSAVLGWQIEHDDAFCTAARDALSRMGCA